MDVLNMKTCNTCGLQKHLDSFSSGRAKCKYCVNKASRDKYSKDKEHQLKCRKQKQDEQQSAGFTAVTNEERDKDLEE